MAEPTLPVILGTVYANAIKVISVFEASTATATTGLADRIALALDSVTGTQAQGMRTVLEAIKAALLGPLTQAQVRDVIDAVTIQLGIAVNSPRALGPSQDVDLVWRDVFDGMADGTPDTIKRRGIVFGAFGAFTTPNAGPVPDGSVTRVTLDERGYPRDGWHADTYDVVCTLDGQGGGSVHEESFELRGTEISGDGNLKRAGTGLVEALSAKSARTSLFKNASFSQWTSAAVLTTPAAPTNLPDWIVPTGGPDLADFLINLDLTYRTEPGASLATNASLEWTTNTTLQKDFAADGITIQEDSPYLLDFAIYRRTGALGSLTVTLGGNTKSVFRTIDLTLLTNEAWTRVQLVLAPGVENWPREFNDSDLKLTLSHTGHGGANILTDDFVFVPMDRVGSYNDTRTGRGSMGTYVTVIGGQIPFLLGTTSQAVDTIASDAVMGRWIAEADRGYLPNAVAPTIVDP